MKWAYRLNLQGKRLRAIINNGSEDLESCKETLFALLDCYRAIKRMLPEDDCYEFGDEQENIEDLLKIFSEDKVLMEDQLLDLEYNDANLPLQATNESLKIFYDLCDYYRVWIGV